MLPIILMIIAIPATIASGFLYMREVARSGYAACTRDLHNDSDEEN